MGRALRLATLGAPVGGGVNYPESITDDFSADSGLWLDGDLAAAAITVSGGKGVWAPTEGSEINTGPNAASDPNSNEANATTGWSGSTVVLSVESVDVDTGSYAVKATANDGKSDRAEYTWSAPGVRGWVLERGAVKAPTGTSWSTYTTISSPVRPRMQITDAWQDFVSAHYKDRDVFGLMAPYCYSGAASDVALIDNVSAKMLTPASTVRLQRIYYPSTLSVKVWGNTFTPKGLITYKDETNWIAALVYRSFVVTTGNYATYAQLIKTVGGVISSVSLQVVTYADGAVLELIPAADFQTWTVKYDDTTVVNAAAVTDFEASGTWYAGLLNTYDAGDTSAVGFDDFSATRIAEAPPF